MVKKKNKELDFWLDKKPLLMILLSHRDNDSIFTPIYCDDKLDIQGVLKDLNLGLDFFEWDSYIPLSYILNIISKISKNIKLSDESQDAYRFYNKGVDSFETVIRKRLVDYRKGDIYD